MAGIYIHIPFCKTRCIYCDFFAKTNLSYREIYVRAICDEITLRKDYLEGDSISTIYFGGGTPSQLSIKNIQLILETISRNYLIEDKIEITFEANPDDLNETYLSELKRIGINRLSLGVQSFDNTILRLLNRRHTAEKAIEIVEIAKKLGFYNISIDLMYGLPSQDLNLWEETLDKAISLDIQHISAYHLIYEDGTKMTSMLEKGVINELSEDLSLAMFSMLIDYLKAADFLHYEISNFGKKGFLSKHNSSYWLEKKYLGLGSSSHSYNKINRSWNIASISKYIEGIEKKSPNIEIENCSENNRYNDYILTRLRTMWGINRTELLEKFGKDKLSYFEKNIERHIQRGNICIENKDILKLSQNGIFISDTIMSDLMYVD